MDILTPVIMIKHALTSHDHKTSNLQNHKNILAIKILVNTPRVLDISPTKHLVFMLFAAALVALTFILSAGAISRAQAAGRPPKGIAGAMEATALYIRQEVVLPNVGPHGEGFAPYLLTLFFFILAMNLLGLLPWGADATGNIAVTASLAVMPDIVIELKGKPTKGCKR